MCTVTFVPGRLGYRLGMNRDETRRRTKGLPPAKKVFQGRTFLAPSEPTGGTWVGVNDAGVCFALINWYSVQRRAQSHPVSRGKIIRATQWADTPSETRAALKEMPLDQISPFRLIAVFPQAQCVVEWGWNLKRLSEKRHRWTAQQWASSGFDEPGAQRAREKIFRTACEQKTFGTADWLRRLHRSHLPEPGPYSICMHRDDAVTVSYTEVGVVGPRARMFYHDGPPCDCDRLASQERLRRKERGPDFHPALTHSALLLRWRRSGN